MRRFLVGIFCVFLLAGGVAAATNFPALTGRVVDNAHLLSNSARQQLEQQLADYEQGTSNQVVVTTVPSLEGLAIEEYGVQLGRYWHIGQQGKDNGVLLIIAPKEHEARIEVGYGLEGVLTDALSSQIIQSVILPNFRAGNMEKGVVDGTQAILYVLGGKSIAAPVVSALPDSAPIHAWQLYLILFGIVFYLWLCVRHPAMAWFLARSVLSFGGGSRGGNSFSGGGGSFGGGGASGRW